MYSIKKWIASKISNSSNDDLNGFNSAAGRSSSEYCSSSLEQSSSQQLTFNVANGAKTILQFYYSDDELNMIASELESFDGRRDPLRCTELVSKLRIAQDKVMQLLFQLMDEWNCNRAPRDYRLKFPEDLLNDSENGESFNGQIWFSAECLASGSDIMNHEAESDMLRPLAKILTNNLDQLRILLRQSSNEISNKIKFYQELIHRMEQFDRMFSAFEFEYVKAMLPIKSVDDIEKQQELTVLFSEALGFALKRNLIAQIDVDEFNPSVMIALPRLAIVHGLTRCGNDNPLFRRHKHNLSNMFKSYHSSLHRIQGMLKSLRLVEIFMLEKSLSNEESLSDCADSLFEEPLSFKQEEFNEQPTLEHQMERKSLKDENHQFKFIKSKSKSLPNLRELEQVNNCNLNKTIDDKLLNGDDEIDASFKRFAKRIKKCVSQMLVQPKLDTEYTTDEYICQNLYFNEDHRLNSPNPYYNQFNECNQQQFNSNSPCQLNSQYNNDHYHNQPYFNQQPSQEKRSHQTSNDNSYIATSQQSTNASLTTGSSVDSYEISLALNAKGSNYISDTAKELLHELFKSISGIADQLQSNFASDLRQILKLVFILHTSSIDEADNTSLEEAEEALESNSYPSSASKQANFEEILNNSENLQLLFGTTLNVIENAQVNNANSLPREETVDYDYNNDSDNIYENYPINYQSSFTQSNNDQSLMNDLSRTNNRSLQSANGSHYPLVWFKNSTPEYWVPDKDFQNCSICKTNFTLLRRRHHCRDCGGGVCNNCSLSRKPVPSRGWENPVRVCNMCI